VVERLFGDHSAPTYRQGDCRCSATSVPFEHDSARIVKERVENGVRYHYSSGADVATSQHMDGRFEFSVSTPTPVCVGAGALHIDFLNCLLGNSRDKSATPRAIACSRFPG